MKRRGKAAFHLCLALTLVCIVFVPSTVNGQGPREPRALSGTVYYAGGNQPAENVSVELHAYEGTMIAPQATDAKGWFEFRGLERGVYTITIHPSGFEPVNLNFDLSFNSSRGNVIYLKAILKDSDQPPQRSPVSAHELSMPQKARDLMQSGRKKLYQGKDAQDGLADFEGAVVAAPGYYEAYYQIAVAYLTLGKRDDAEKNFRKSIEVSGGSYGNAEIGLGSMMLDHGSFADGEKTIRRGIELSPDSWLGHYELGRALLNENRISEAQESAELARSLAPSVPIIYRLLSNIHLREKDYHALLQDLDAYIHLDPASPAGVHAKELRAQVQHKLAADELQPTTGHNPR
jgi:tetratricopeptide (TPR) repeat protein